MSMSESAVPAKLAELLDTLDFVDDRSQRIQLLIDIGSRFTEVPEHIATRPFDEAHRVPACESEAFVWSEPRPDGTLDFHFAVENPQGISARPLSTILGDTLSGAPLEEVAAIDEGLIYRVFGRELSMGKSMGLTGIVAMVRRFAERAMGEQC
jgi:cysteine desulfuration protein SufE